ncbi:hypothetical protein DNTS_024653 [Danionella cerebrum]|uniref:Uncharacterized protein n=1 Tax=Danionella cerebrum TaxID=2873325 RepID=A0A553NHR7_9TELE|nr:hypothetical protein DNTS_024653 [Danionella translucida]
MPTTFSGSRRKFSEDLLKSGMYRDSGLNTMTDKTQLTGPNTASRYYDRINFHSFYQSAETSQ